MNENAVCHIVGAGDFFGMEKPSKNDFVIAADGGLKYLRQEGIQADLVIGDFDSFGSIPTSENVIGLPCEKDDTDTAAAVEEAIKIGFKSFVLYGAVGGRFDHTIANLQLIAQIAQMGFKASINAGENTYTALTNGKIKLSALDSGYISVFSHSDLSKGVTIENLKYEAKNIELRNSIALGVSNEFKGEDAFIEVKDGTLLIIHPSDSKVYYLD